MAVTNNAEISGQYPAIDFPQINASQNGYLTDIACHIKVRLRQFA
jgi:hypothetical protein